MNGHILAGAVFAAAAALSGAASADPYGLGATCPQVYQDGSYIRAVCYTAAFTLHRTSIDASRCGDTGVQNWNGDLVCGYELQSVSGGLVVGQPERGWRERRRRHGPNWD